ncbi:hypothetical protein Bhyg_01216 [Pseudolycoriella hygida]|uniref:Uncharacterized protein n=1 Tax=Pseudolycoriella hygida TaxID=35572 RepID=A0A9Q0N904_9DIPT|nr:hypothetical protein Bhyg_01216 [Pseudolycoriella hygida]
MSQHHSKTVFIQSFTGSPVNFLLRLISAISSEKFFNTMDLLVDLSSLSEDIREKLAELDLELSEVP